MNEERIDSLIKWAKENEDVAFDLDSDKYFFEPLLEAFGDDSESIFEYLNSMDIGDLDFISGCFSRIYGKFMTDEVWDRLGELENKINEQSTRMKEYRKREGNGK